jgi:hypothetical protein
MRTLKLVGAKTYVGPRSKDAIILKGQTLVIEDDAVADAMLAETQKDLLNNEHPMWHEVKHGEAAPARMERTRPAPAKASAAKPARGGSRTAKPKPAVEADDDEQPE